MAAPTVPDVAPARMAHSIPGAPSHGRRAVQSKRTRAFKRQLLAIAFVLPALALLGVMTGYPLGRLVATSFQELGPFQLINH